MNIINADVLDQAIEAFHGALDKHVDDDEIHDRAADWVHGGAEAIVEALLLDGWTPPQPDGGYAHR